MEVTTRNCDVCGKENIQEYVRASVSNSHYAPNNVWPVGRAAHNHERNKECCSVECARKVLGEWAKAEIDIEGLRVLAERNRPDLAAEIKKLKDELVVANRLLDFEKKSQARTSDPIDLRQACPTWDDLLRLFKEIYERPYEERSVPHYQSIDECIRVVKDLLEKELSMGIVTVETPEARFRDGRIQGIRDAFVLLETLRANV